MTQAASVLFRQEVLDRRGQRLQGAVSIATPLSWQLIGFSLFAALIASAAFLSIASYSRVETAIGTVALDRGVASIVPTRAGVVAEVNVQEGQAVKAGQELLSIRSEEDAMGGETAPQRMRTALTEQDARVLIVAVGH